MKSSRRNFLQSSLYGGAGLGLGIATTWEVHAAPLTDAVTSPTPNGSFNPADYILPAGPKDSTPYQLLLEINQPGDDQASLVYAVEIDNSLPRGYQLLELKGFPKREADDEKGKEVWGLYYVDETFTTALDLIDSALLTIQR